MNQRNIVNPTAEGVDIIVKRVKCKNVRRLNFEQSVNLYLCIICIINYLKPQGAITGHKRHILGVRIFEKCL